MFRDHSKDALSRFLIIQTVPVDLYEERKSIIKSE